MLKQLAEVSYSTLGQHWNSEINKIMTSSEVKKLADMEMQVASMRPREFASIIHGDADHYGRVIK
jgi:hypothetical protein